MKKIILTLLCTVAASTVVAQASGPAGLNAGMRAKFESRMDAVNGHLANLEGRVAAVQAYQNNVSTCYLKSMFYKPSSSSADSDGCVGAKLVSYSETHDINISAGGCKGSAEYTIPAHVISDIQSATFHTNFEKVGDRTLAFTKGIAGTVHIKKKVKSGWFDDEYCHVHISYDGNDLLSTSCSGDGSKYCNQNSMKFIEYSGTKMVLGD